MPIGFRTAATAASANGTMFAWADCSEEDIHKRVFMKQQAVDDALRHAMKICQEIRSPNEDDDATSSAPINFEERCGRDMKVWMAEIDKLHESRQNFEVLIGVVGRTGAGKSTILNMLLEIPELLPSSNSEAATSCACRVSWNPDNDPNRKFRAEVAFRSFEDVRRELDEIFATIRQRQHGNDDDIKDGESPFDWMQQQAEMENGIEEGVKKINAVWGLDEEALETMSPKEILRSNRTILQLLGTIHTIHSEDAEQFAETVKPYLDSSETAQGFKAWPLIKEVKLFVKAPLLEHGAVLVDLPGLSDAVESRAQVAERYRQHLDITAIVTPARRAIDDKTGVQLMSDYQALRMQLDGKYHRKGFCVVVSQVDEIDCDVFIKGHPLAKKDDELRENTRFIDVLTQRSAIAGVQLKEEEKDLERIAERLSKVNNTIDAYTPTGSGSRILRQQAGFRKGADKARRERKEIKRERDKKKKVIEDLEKAKTNTDKRLAALRARQIWECVSMRNDHIINTIEGDFAHKQKKTLGRDVYHNDVYDGSVDVIPVSATAFRDILKDREPMGFPTLAHTGIPRLRRWLEDAMLEQREENLDTLLHALRRLFSTIQRWSNINLGNQTIVFSRETVEELLARTHAKYSVRLESELERGSKEVKILNPFKQIGDRSAKCKRVVRKAVTRWALKFPQKKKSWVLMHWGTFDAILKRNGGPYRTRGPERIEYNFPEALVVPLLEAQLKQWNDTFRVAIPSTEKPLRQRIRKICQEYFKELDAQIKKTAPSVLPHSAAIMHIIHSMELEMLDKIHSVLRGLSKSSSTIHPEFLLSFRKQLNPIYAEALTIRGKNQFKNRCTYLLERVNCSSDSMFALGYQRMRAKYNKKVSQLPQDFLDLASSAITNATTQITLLLDNLAGTSSTDWVVAGMQPSRQQRLQKTIMEWQMDWETPKIDESALKREEVEIPKTFGEKDGQEALERESGSKGSEDGSGSDSED